jgi:hypothetical protein
VTGICPLNDNIFVENEFLFSCVAYRPYSWVTEPAYVSLRFKDKSEEVISAGFVKVSAEIIKPFPKDGPRKSERRKHGKSRIQTDMPENTEIENQRAQKLKENIQRKHLRRKL